MATTLQSRIAPRERAGGDKSQQRDGHRAAPAVARVALGWTASEHREVRRPEAAAVRGITAAALRIRVLAREVA